MTRLVCGLDEAGLGPILGPLTLAYSVLRLPDDGVDPWRLLRPRVSRDPRRDRTRLIVADSKKVFTRNRRGRRRLETTVLSFLALLREDARPPADATELLFGNLRPDPALVARHPWYARLPALPRELEPERIELAAGLLGRTMRQRGCELVDAGVRIVPAGELNASYRETGSKAATLWHKTLEVLRYFWRAHGREAPAVTVDLQGGRTYYGPLLARAFPDAVVTLVREGRGHAEYRLRERGAFLQSDAARRLDLLFLAKAEDRSFPVALGSCLAKYARELVMEAFNAYFFERQPDLRPTAGYTTDGRRWLEDARPLLSRVRLEQSVLVRER